MRSKHSRTSAAGLQRPDRAHRGSAGGGYFDPRQLRARAAAHLVSQLDLCRPLERGRGEARVPAPFESAIRRSCWCATTTGVCKASTTPAATAGRSCAARARGTLRTARHRLPVPRLGLQPATAICCAPPRRRIADGFDLADYPLYGVKVLEWSGFVFVRLARGSAGRSSGMFDLPLNRLDAWPLKDLVVGHVLEKTMRATGRSSGRTTTSACIARACIRSSRASCRSSGAGFSRSATIREWSRASRRMPIPSTRAACARARPPGRTTAGSRARRSPGLSEEDRKLGPRVHDRLAVDVHRRPRRLRARRCGCCRSDPSARELRVEYLFSARDAGRARISTCATWSISPIR